MPVVDVGDGGQCGAAFEHLLQTLELAEGRPSHVHRLEICTILEHGGDRRGLAQLVDIIWGVGSSFDRLSHTFS